MRKENVLMMNYIDILKKTCIINKQKKENLVFILKKKKIGWLI